MKSKLLLTVLAVAFSVSSFASFTKTDSGFVSWTVNINKKQDGVLTYSRNRIQVNGSNASSTKEFEVARQLGWNSGVGGIHKIPMNFELTDERSQGSVEIKIKELIAKDIKNYSVEGKDAVVTLEGLSCKETGFFRKKLTCNAQFEHVQVLELK